LGLVLDARIMARNRPAACDLWDNKSGAMNRAPHSLDNYEKGIIQTAFDRRLE
jgi:hypothetical protein